MKTSSRKILVLAACFLIASAIHTFAIEGLQISVQCSNVMLSWPSDEFSGETYIVQYKPDLVSTNPWITLTNYMPPGSGTNITVFVHSNVVQNPCNCGGNGNYTVLTMTASSLSRATVTTSLNSGLSVGERRVAWLLATAQEPLCMLKGDWGTLLPVNIYPPGFDFSGFTIYDPASGEWEDGAVYTAQALASRALSVNTIQANGAQGLDMPQPAGGSGDSTFVPETGFYRVVRNGAHLFALTNGAAFSGMITIPVEVGNDSGSLVNLSIVEDGVPVSDVSIQLAPFSGFLQVPVETTQMANGSHDIFAHAAWQVTTGINEGDSYSVEADSPPVTINVFNEISFTNWMSSFGELGNSLLISAQSAHTDTDWTIDVYGANAGYIGTFTGHTYDGNIYGAWDLTGPPPDYISYTNEPWFQFKVSTPYVDPPSPKTYKQTDLWAGKGDWVMAAQHAWDNVYGSDDLYDELDGYVSLAQSLGLNVRPGTGNGHAFALHYDESGQDPQGVVDWAAFRQALTNSLSRNLLYLGHGDGTGLGHNLSNPERSILATDIANMLHTIPTGQTNRHAFRMVILDGCSTASGALPEAFGIPHKQGMTDQDFLFASQRPRAFVGWSADKYIGIQSGGLNYDHIHFIQHIPEGMILEGRGIESAIEYARTRTDVNDGYVHGREFKVFGDKDLGFNSYNQ